MLLFETLLVDEFELLASLEPPHADSMASNAHSAPPLNTCVITLSPSKPDCSGAQCHRAVDARQSVCALRRVAIP
jgi:hypothetical protein